MVVSLSAYRLKAGKCINMQCKQCGWKTETENPLELAHHTRKEHPKKKTVREPQVRYVSTPTNAYTPPHAADEWTEYNRQMDRMLIMSHKAQMMKYFSGGTAMPEMPNSQKPDSAGDGGMQMLDIAHDLADAWKEGHELGLAAKYAELQRDSPNETAQFVELAKVAGDLLKDPNIQGFLSKLINKTAPK